MRKFLSVRGQAALSSLIALAAMLVIMGWALPLIANPPAWARPVGDALTFGAFVMLIAVSLVCQVPLRSYDLKEAAERMKEREQAWNAELATIRFERVTFRKMTWLNKLGYVFFMLAGAGFFVYGLLDLLGFVPTLKLPVRGGEPLVVSNFASSIAEMLFSAIPFMTAQICFKSRLTDPIDDLVDRAMSTVVRGDFGGKIH